MDWIPWLFVGTAAFKMLRMVRRIRLLYRLREHGVVAAGIVVRLREDQRRSRGDISRVPVVRYFDLYGRVVEAESQDSRHDSDMLIGSDAYLVYDPALPMNFFFTDELTVARSYWKLIGFALLLLLSLLVAVSKPVPRGHIVPSDSQLREPAQRSFSFNNSSSMAGAIRS